MSRILCKPQASRNWDKFLAIPRRINIFIRRGYTKPAANLKKVGLQVYKLACPEQCDGVLNEYGE